MAIQLFFTDWYFTSGIRAVQSMADGHNTRYSQLAESLASVRQTQEIQHQNQEALQQALEGLTNQLQLVVANVDTLVHTRGKQTEDTPSGLRSHMRNPLFEEQGGIQTRAIRLNFPKFNREEPNGWIYRANQFLLFIKPTLIIESSWLLFTWRVKPSFGFRI